MLLYLTVTFTDHKSLMNINVTLWLIHIIYSFLASYCTVHSTVHRKDIILHSAQRGHHTAQFTAQCTERTSYCIVRREDIILHSALRGHHTAQCAEETS